MTKRVWMDDRLVPADQATVDVTDRGWLLGHGVFETVRIDGGIPFGLSRHLQRLRRSAAIAAIDLRWDDDALHGAVKATTDAAVSDLGVFEGRLRVTVTAGPEGGSPTLLITAMVGPLPTGPAAVVLSPWSVNEHGPLVGAKTTSRLDYTLALHEARNRGADEAVLVNTAGHLVEASASNLFLVVAGRLSTPALSTGCLPGVTRDLVMESSEVAERDDLTIDDLRFAPEAFLTSTTRGVQPISTVDGGPLRSVPGPLTRSAAVTLDTLRATNPNP